MATSKPYYTPDEIIEQIDKLIARFGIDAFKTDGRTQLYSGPQDVIRKVFDVLYGKGTQKRNFKRAFEQTAWELSTVIDQTIVGKFAGEFDIDGVGNKLDIYQYFEYWAAKNPSLVTGPDWARESADRVMRHASRKFAEAVHGDVYTTVCGAATDMMFCKVELPALIANKKVANINGLSMDVVRAFYAINPYEAFRLICAWELKEIKQHADQTGNIKDWSEWKDRYAFHVAGQHVGRRKFLRPAPKTKQALKKVLETCCL